MKVLSGLLVCLAFAAMNTVVAEEAKEAKKAAKKMESGLKEGARLGAFDVVKCAGEEADSVAIGKKLCYRCRNGSRPQVIVFTRSTDKSVTKLVAELDKHVKKFEDEQLRAFVNVVGESKPAAEKMVKALAKSTKTENIPYVVPVEFENGPENYALNPKAELTIIVANESKVVANFAVKSAKDLKVNSVLESVEKMFN